MNIPYKNSFFQKGSTNILLSIVIALLVGIGAYLYFIYDNNEHQVIDQEEVVQTKAQEAEEVFKNVGREDARPLFEEALDTSTSYAEEGQIAFRLASIDAFSDDNSKKMGSIDAFREVAANRNYSDYIRANSIEFIARIHSFNNDPVIFDYIFNHPDFVQFLVEGDTDLSLRNLYEYASALYPTARIELRLASAYSREILALQEQGQSATTEAAVTALKALVRNNFSNTDREIQGLLITDKNDPRILNAMNRKAVAVGYLTQGGDTSFGDPEVMFRDTLEEAINQNNVGQFGFTKYYYAAFLANTYGSQRVDDVEKLLKDFYTTDIYDDRTVMAFFENTKDIDVDNFFRRDLVTLASVDENFKTLLNELGWEL